VSERMAQLEVRSCSNAMQFSTMGRSSLDSQKSTACFATCLSKNLGGKPCLT